MAENLITVVEENDMPKKVRPGAKRLTTQNVWEEINLLNEKIDTLEAKVDALSTLDAKIDSTSAQLDSLAPLSKKVDSLAAKLDSIDSINTKMDSLSAKVCNMSTEIGSLGVMSLKLDSLNSRVDNLASNVKNAPEEKETQKHGFWWGLFIIGTAVATVGAVLLALPQALIGLGLLGAGAAVDAVSGMKMWGKPQEQK